MADFPFDLVGFDLDGTLVDSAGDLAAAVNHALGVAGRAPLDVEQVRPMIGGGSRLMLQRALQATGGDDAIDELLPVLLDYYAAHLADETRPFPGVVAALDDIRALGVRLAVVTNKREAFATALLSELDLSGYFACVIGGDSVATMKPDPAPIVEMLRRCGSGRAVFVGDSAFDVGAARAAGVPCIIYAPVKSADLGADAVIGDYALLVSALRGVS